MSKRKKAKVTAREKYSRAVSLLVRGKVFVTINRIAQLTNSRYQTVTTWVWREYGNYVFYPITSDAALKYFHLRQRLIWLDAAFPDGRGPASINAIAKCVGYERCAFRRKLRRHPELRLYCNKILKR